jgi:hypothetical protein
VDGDPERSSLRTGRARNCPSKAPRCPWREASAHRDWQESSREGACSAVAVYKTSEAELTFAIQSDVIKRVEAVLAKRDAHAGTFSDIGQHAPVAGIRAGAQAFKDGGADVIVAVAGGSPIDASKVRFLYNTSPCLLILDDYKR